MTKLHEQVERSGLAELAARSDTLETRGEFVVVIGPPAPADTAMTDSDLDRALKVAMAGSSLKDAVTEIAAISGRARREVYARALALTRQGRRDGKD
jgi:16S rRNA (cytidine1402-2'-O)-methyltransferase